MEDKRSLPPSELEIMLAVWAGEGAMTAPEILERLGRSLTPSALHSYLRRLEEKGFLCCEKGGKANRYRALISRRDYQARESRSILDRLYGRSLKRFAAALYDGGGLGREEVAELRDYLDTLEKELGREGE